MSDFELRAFHRERGIGFTITMKDQEEVEQVYRDLAEALSAYEVSITRIERHVTGEVIAGNIAFVNDCMTWGPNGPHAGMIKPAKAGDKRIMGAKERGVK